MEKLYLHLFTKGIEHYGNTQWVLKEINAILDTPYEILYENLQEAYQQAHRKSVLTQNKIGLSHEDIGSSISISNEKESVLKQLLKTQVSIEQLEKFIKNQIKNYDKTKL